MCRQNAATIVAGRPSRRAARSLGPARANKSTYGRIGHEQLPCGRRVHRVQATFVRARHARSSPPAPPAGSAVSAGSSPKYPICTHRHCFEVGKAPPERVRVQQLGRPRPACGKKHRSPPGSTATTAALVLARGSSARLRRVDALGPDSRSVDRLAEHVRPHQPRRRDPASRAWPSPARCCRRSRRS